MREAGIKNSSLGIIREGEIVKSEGKEVKSAIIALFAEDCFRRFPQSPSPGGDHGCDSNGGGTECQEGME